MREVVREGHKKYIRKNDAGAVDIYIYFCIFFFKGHDQETLLTMGAIRRSTQALSMERR